MHLKISSATQRPFCPWGELMADERCSRRCCRNTINDGCVTLIAYPYLTLLTSLGYVISGTHKHIVYYFNDPGWEVGKQAGPRSRWTLSGIFDLLFLITNALRIARWIYLIARFMGPTWGPPGADRTQVGPMLAPWTLLTGMIKQHTTYNEEEILNYHPYFRDYFGKLVHQEETSYTIIINIINITHKFLLPLWYKCKNDIMNPKKLFIRFVFM